MEQPHAEHGGRNRGRTGPDRIGRLHDLAVDGPEQLLAAVRGAADGVSLFMPSVTRRLVERFARPHVEPPAAELTVREREVWTLLAKGQSNAEIAATLVIGETTVKTHVSRLLMKLGAASRSRAVVLADETGLVRPGEDAGVR